MSSKDENLVEQYKTRNAYTPEDEHPAPHKSTPRRAPKGKHLGCYGNHGGAHVYVLVRIIWDDSNKYRRGLNGSLVPVAPYIRQTDYVRVCVGCGRIAKRYYAHWADRRGNPGPVGSQFMEEDIYETVYLGRVPSFDIRARLAY